MGLNTPIKAELRHEGEQLPMPSVDHLNQLVRLLVQEAEDAGKTLAAGLAGPTATRELRAEGKEAPCHEQQTTHGCAQG